MRVKLARACDADANLVTLASLMADAASFQLGPVQSYQHILGPKVCVSGWQASHTGFFDTVLTVGIRITIAAISSYDGIAIAGERVRLYQAYHEVTLPITGSGLFTWEHIYRCSVSFCASDYSSDTDLCIASDFSLAVVVLTALNRVTHIGVTFGCEQMMNFTGTALHDGMRAKARECDAVVNDTSSSVVCQHAR